MNSIQHDFMSNIRKKYGLEVENTFKMLDNTLQKNFPKAVIQFNDQHFTCKIIGAESLDCERFLEIFSFCKPMPPKRIERPLTSWEFSYLGKDDKGIHILTLNRIVSQKEFNKIVSCVRKASDHLAAAFKPKTPLNNELFYSFKEKLNEHLTEIQFKPVDRGIDGDLRKMFYYHRRLTEIFRDNAQPAKL